MATTARLVQHAPWWLKALTGLLKPWEKQTCDIGVYLATAPEVAHTTGVFFDDNRQIMPLPGQYDPAVGEKLWQLSEELTNQAEK